MLPLIGFNQSGTSPVHCLVFKLTAGPGQKFNDTVLKEQPDPGTYGIIVLGNEALPTGQAEWTDRSFHGQLR